MKYLGLGQFTVSFEDLIAAFLGSLLLVILWWLFRWYTGSVVSLPPSQGVQTVDQAVSEP